MTNDPSAPRPAGLNRRRWFALGFGAAAAAAVGLIGRELWRFFHPPGPPPRIPDGASTIAGLESDFAPGFGREIRFASRHAIVFRTRDGAWKAFDATCTHKYCTVMWNPKQEAIICPCHQGRFDLQGRPVAGPPKAPLDPLDVVLREGRVIVTKPMPRV